MAEGTGYPGQIQVRDADTKAPVDVYGDPTSGSVRVGMRYYDGSGNLQAQPKIATDAQMSGMGMGFAGSYTIGNVDYIACEDGSGNYIITRIDRDKLGTATDSDVMFATGTGGLPAKANWAALTYQDREAAF